MKLTKPQRIVLRVMARYSCSASVFRKNDIAFALLRSMRNKLYAGTLLALQRKGLLRTIREYDWHESRFILTKAGREKAKELEER